MTTEDGSAYQRHNSDHYQIVLGRLKVKMEKEVKKWSSNTRVSPPKPAMNTAEQANRTKPERRLVSFAADMMVLANKAAEGDESLPAEIQEHKYEEAKSLSTNVLKEADLNRGLELYKTYKKRVNESCLEHLPFDDLLVLANTASFAFTGNFFKEVVVPLGVEEQRGDEASSLKVVKPNRDPSDACRDDKWFKNKYVRRKRVENKDHIEVFKKLCTHKSSSFFNVDAADIKESLLYNYSETLSKFEQGQCSKAQNGDEIETTATSVSRKKQFDRLYASSQQEYPKKKRSQRKRRPKNSGERGEGKEQTCEQIHTCDNFGEEAETEEEKGNVSDARNSSSCNPWSGFSFNVQWSNKKKRGSMKLEGTQSNRKILLLAVEAITNQLRLLEISM